MLIDIVLIAILSLFIFIGWKRGLVMSVFLLGSTIVAIFLASVFSPVVATGLEKMGLPEKMAPTFSSYAEDAINEKLEEKATIKTEQAVENLPLPGFVKDKVVEKVDEVAAEEVSKIADSIGMEAAKAVCALIAFVLIFVLVLILMQVVKGVLKFAVKLPLVKQVDKTAGIAVGFVQGGLLIFIALLLVSILSSFSFMQGTIEAIENSTITKFLYESNFIGKIISNLL